MSTTNTSYHAARMEFADKIYNTPGMLPHRYVMVLTNRCNLRCSFCFQEKNHIEGSLTTEDWLRLIDQLPDYAHVTLTGGEPFLFKGFKEVFNKVTERLTCNIISNGLLLNNDLIDLLLDRPKFKVLSISVDNIGNTVREVNPDKWKAAEELMRTFVRRRNELNSETVLDTKTVVLDDNAGDLLDIHRYCIEELSADTHSFMLLKGHPIQHADLMYPLAAMFQKSKAHVYKKFDLILEQLESVRQYNRRNNKRCFTHPKIMDLNGDLPLNPQDYTYINQEDHHPELFQPCKAPWESVHINVEGNLFPCMAIKMGNVKELPLKEIVTSPVFTQFKDTIRACGTTEGCNRCGYLLPAASSAEIS